MDLSPELQAELRTIPPDAHPGVFGALAVRAGQLQPGAVGVLTRAWSADLPPDAAPEVVARYVDNQLASPTYGGFLRAGDATPAPPGVQVSSHGGQQPGSLDQIAVAWRAQHQTHGLHRLQDPGEVERVHREAMERTRASIGHFQAPADRSAAEAFTALHRGRQQQAQQNPITTGFGLRGVRK